MKALVYTGAGQVEHRDEPPPSPAAGDEALLRVLRCGICGSDRHAFHGRDERRLPPLILGHEAVGVIDGDADGAIYAVNPLIVCGSCDACIGGRENLCARRGLLGMSPHAGAFAEYALVPRRNLSPTPAGTPLAVAALTEPAACAWHGVRLAAAAAARPLAELSALVLGGGAIGLLSAAALRLNGCRRVALADISPLRQDTAKRAGDWEVMDAANLPADEFYDIVIDAVGCEPTRESASARAAAGGVIAHLGLETATGGLDVRRLTLREITFIGVYTYTAADFAAVLRLLAAGAYGDINTWCEERPLADGAQAFADLDGGTAAAKIILTME